MKKGGFKTQLILKIDGTMFRSQDIYQRSKRLAEKANLHSIGCHGFGIPQHYYSNQIMLGLK